MNDYPVHCHRCKCIPYGPNGESWAGVVGSDPSAHLRSDAVLLGSAKFGGLWHCKAHADNCRLCPRRLYSKGPQSPAETAWKARSALSAEERAARRPIHPAVLMSAKHGKCHKD